jgi:hypothetical protein
LSQATRKAVISVNDYGIHDPLPAVGNQFVQSRSLFTRAADSNVNVLVCNGESAPLAKLAEFAKLDFRILAVVECADPRVQGCTDRTLAAGLLGRCHAHCSELRWASGATENKRRPQSGGSWRTFALLPHRAEAHTTVLSSRLVALSRCPDADSFYLR